MSEHGKKPRKDVHVWVQTAGGILSIAVVAGGAVVALFQSHPVRVAAAVLCAGIVVGGVFKRNWWMVGAPLLAMIALVALAPSPTPEANAQPPQTQANQSNKPSASTSTSANTSPATTTKNNSGPPAPIATFDVDITPHDAVNIDNPAGPVIANSQSGATSGNDIYLYDHAVASPRLYITNSGTMVYPQVTSGDEYNACANKLKPGSGANTYGYSGVDIEVKICFYTSENNMAYAAITGVDQPNGAEPPRKVTLHVIVWKRP